MKQDIFPRGNAFGAITNLQEQINEALKNGATDFFCSIDYPKNGKAYVRWIEFYRELSEKEVLLNKLEKALRAVTEIKKEIDKLNGK